MNQRQEALLGQVIKEYLHSAVPIGSKTLENKSHLGLSSATIRNALAELEELGYIVQPHTSAGRIPTCLGYQYFLDNQLKNLGKITAKEEQDLKQLAQKWQNEPLELLIRNLARKLADLSNNAIVVGFADNSFYYTGLANLFSQPEFQDPSCVYDLSLIIDHLDQVMNRLFNEVTQATVKIGAKNPFGQQCSVVLINWRFKKQSGLLGILGPVRMDYEKNLGLVNFIREQI
ncbi:MAG: hypothetical protein NTZ18_04030 [Candidatus Komeilibacteria bacterium]|nr:hypothetical protein [Candidatus Komeilibacteria bacterium]